MPPSSQVGGVYVGLTPNVRETQLIPFHDVELVATN